MYHVLLRDTGFGDFLFEVGEDVAAQTWPGGCSCGGRLHRANYWRKPCGGSPPLPKSRERRLSFYCHQDGCRKRGTPPSVRFLGCKVFLGAVVVLVVHVMLRKPRLKSQKYPG